MVTLWRMQVTTSCRMRRPGSWKSTSLVTTVGTRMLRGEVRELVQPELVVRPPAQRERQVGAIAEGLAQAAQPQAAVLVGDVRHQDRDQAFAIGDEIGPFEMALAPCRRASCRATAAGRAANRPGGRSDRRAPTCRRRDRAGSRRSAGRRSPWPPHGRARCRPASCDRRRRAPRCRARRPARTAPRRRTRRAGSEKCEVTCSSA